MEIKLTPVTAQHYNFLYDMLKERDTKINISHKEIPAYEDHVKFVQSCPYAAWYIILSDNAPIGNIYLTRNNEIGIFILKAWQRKGVAKKAIQELMRLHPRECFLANINPKNKKSQLLFNKLGFKLIQETYKFENVA